MTFQVTNMNKLCAAALLAVITGLTSAWAWAANHHERFELFFSVPSRPFYIIPTESDWIHVTQPLVWDYPQSTLIGLRKSFDVRHDTSAIEARLDAEPSLWSGRDSIALRVRFNGVELSADPVFRQVLSKEEAAQGKRVPLEIDPIKPAGGFKAGEYAGTVMLLFNARAPGE
ncbi:MULTISPECIES: CS1 type fimbrial major subunit [unclassified Pseudomonas]|uniref:CS1 type fimbrial major subunit n=1 Tax=unclassified Pseudomonas TaxID=196821 RepID=UPI00200F00CD|nr:MULTISPECIES: CS1 type fimbrial major subunit [unclassified Pseudomonas]